MCAAWWSATGWSIGPIVQPRFDGYEEDDSPALEGMDDRDWSVDAGVGGSWLTGIGLFALSYVTDILSRHNGQELQFSYTIMFPLVGCDIIPSAGVRHKSGNLADYYYGVESDEIARDRLPFQCDDATDPFLRLAVRRKLGARWSVLVAAQYEWLADEVTDSPIVDDDYQASFLAGLLYSW
jgi:outer membrane protein